MSDKLSSVLAGSLQFLFLGVDFHLSVFHLVCGFILRRSNDLLCFLLRLVDCLLCNRPVSYTHLAQVLEAIEIDYIDESEVLSPADDVYHIDKTQFKVCLLYTSRCV